MGAATRAAATQGVHHGLPLVLPLLSVAGGNSAGGQHRIELDAKARHRLSVHNAPTLTSVQALQSAQLVRAAMRVQRGVGNP